MQNELVEHGKFAACRNCDAAGAAQRGILWLPSKRSRKHLTLCHKCHTDVKLIQGLLYPTVCHKCDTDVKLIQRLMLGRQLIA
jgi:PHP family Zn ribbon phosphoesterase